MKVLVCAGACDSGVRGAGWFRLGTALSNLQLADEAVVAFRIAAVLEPQCASLAHAVYCLRPSQPPSHT